MIATMHPSPATISASTIDGTLSTRTDADRDEDLYALWNAIFERARPAEVSREESFVPSAIQGDSNADNHSQRASQESSAQHWRGGATQPGVATATPVSGALATTVAATPSVVAQRGVTDSIVAAAPRVSLPAQPQVGALPDETPTFVGVVPGDADQPPSSAHLAAAARPAQTDVINVFVSGAAVSIAVRDAEMSEQDAVHCAFEAARELTGQRAGLRQLTLNGRVLYQHHYDRPPSDARPASALEFAC